MIARRLQMWRLSNFEIARLPAVGGRRQPVRLPRRGTTPSDERLIAVAEVRDLTPIRDEAGRAVALPEVESVLVGCLDAIRRARDERPALRRLEWNRVMLYIWPTIDLPLDEVYDIARRLTPLTEGLGLEQVVVSRPPRPAGRVGAGRDRDAPRLRARPRPERAPDAAARRADAAARRLHAQADPDPAPRPRVPVRARPAARRRRRLVRRARPRRRRAGSCPSTGRRARTAPASSSASSARRPSATRRACTRVAVLGDPTKAMGSITEAECTRLLAAIDLAAAMDVPIEWFALSAGAKIAMDSGSENLDWVARVLRRLVEHTQAGGEVNIVVAGINVGAQPYWNAESTMLMHTRGILVMTPDSAMVLTGKQAIDYSGGVSAEDNLGIGGYGRVMGPERRGAVLGAEPGRGVRGAVRALRADVPGAGRAVAAAGDHRRIPIDRDVREAPHAVEGVDFDTVGDIFSPTRQPRPQEAVRHPHADGRHDRPGPRTARALAGDGRGRDGRRLRRPPRRPRRVPDRHRVAPAAAPRRDAGRRPGPVVGRHAVPAVVEEGRPRDQRGERARARSSCWPTCRASTARRSRCAACSSSTAPRSAGRSSTSTARSCCASCPATTAARSSCSRRRSTTSMEVLAVEGSFASVIGGAPAAAVVFTRDVDERTQRDPRVQAAEAAVAAASVDDAGAPAGRAGRDPRDRAHREARRGRRRVRRRAQRRAGAPGRLGAPHHRGRRAAARS